MPTNDAEQSGRGGSASGSDGPSSMRVDTGGFLRGHEGDLLREQIRWFNRLRFGAILGMAVLSGAALGFRLVDATAPLFWLTGATLVLNVCFVVWLSRRDVRNTRALRTHIDVQIACDLVLLTLLLHFSGGAGNPLLFSFLFHTVIAAFLLSVRAAAVVGTLSVLCAVALAMLERSGLIPHHPLSMGLMDPVTVDPIVLWCWLGTLALVLTLSIVLVAAVVRQIARRDTELLRMSRQLALSEKLASLGTLIAGVSHEINNPVGVIRSKVGVLRYRIADGDPSEVVLAEIDAIDKHARRIGSITEGMLTFARERPFELAPVRVNTIAEEAADLVRVPYRTAGIGLDLRLSPDDPSVSGSSNHLMQVLVNLLLNARDASSADARVTLSTEANQDEVRLTVADEGEGIAAENLPKIFDPFFTTKEVGHGTGLGLALSHGIVDRHGGRIEVQSEVGRGATFAVVIPRLGGEHGAEPTSSGSL